MPRHLLRWSVALVAVTLTWTAPAATQTGSKPPITHDVYDSWRAMQDTTLSRDGVWLIYALAPQDGDGELVARNLRTGTERRHARGRDPVLTADGRFVIFAVAPLDAELDKAKKDKKKPEEQPKAGVAVLNLETGDAFTAERVKSFKVPEESSRYVAWHHEPAPPVRREDEKEKAPTPGNRENEKTREKKKDPGTDLVIRDLTTGTNRTVSDVTDYAWAKDGTLIAYTISSKASEKDGVYVQPPAGSQRALLTGKGHYKGLAIDQAGRQVAFVSDRDEQDRPAPRFELFLASATGAARESLVRRLPGCRLDSPSASTAASRFRKTARECSSARPRRRRPSRPRTRPSRSRSTSGIGRIRSCRRCRRSAPSRRRSRTFWQSGSSTAAAFRRWFSSGPKRFLT